MTDEQLQAIKERFVNMPDGYTISEGVKLIDRMRHDGIALIAEVEKLREALEDIAHHNIFRTPQIYVRDYARKVLNIENFTPSRTELIHRAIANSKEVE